jgi:putative DNA methylase
VPLASSFALSTKKGKETIVVPVVDAASNSYRFEIKSKGVSQQELARAKSGTKAARGANFTCLISGTPTTGDYIKAEGKAGRMGARLMAIVAEGARGRIYLPPTETMEQIAASAEPEWWPEGEVPARLTGGTCYGYGLTEWWKLFTPRQLVALTTFSDLVQEARERVLADAVAAGLPTGQPRLAEGGTGAEAYTDAIVTHLALAINKLSDRSSTLASWDSSRDSVRNTFGRQALPMVWDFSEVNPFSESSGNWITGINWIFGVLQSLSIAKFGEIQQADATVHKHLNLVPLISTDPPYYDNIGYADLSDFFYIWFRRSLRLIYPNIFGTMLVPKAAELVATPYRHGTKQKAEAFFMNGMKKALKNMADSGHANFPVTIYYAFKQSEVESEGIASTGWATFLKATFAAGFSIGGTWPMRTELSNRTQQPHDWFRHQRPRLLHCSRLP